MVVKEIPNKEVIEIKPLVYKCDQSLGCIPAPLPAGNEFFIFCGGSGSGKTSTMTSLITSKNLYKKKYNKIWLFMPQSSVNSLPSTHIFHKYMETMGGHKHNGVIGYVFSEVTADLLHVAKMEAIEDAEKGFNTLIIMDDQMAFLKNNRQIETELKDIIANRRHYHTSIWMLNQLWMQGCPKSLRLQCSVVFLWRPTKKEWKDIKQELFMNYDDDECDQIAKFAYKDPHDFLYITTNRLPNKVYSKNFGELVLE